jgi:4-alpha-glucanotransferase
MTEPHPSILSTRCSGILLHPTSFPGKFGIGDLGSEAHQFIDFLAESQQQLWQILPLGPIGPGNSPYMSYSAMAGNPLLISPERLQRDGLLNEDDFAQLPQFESNSIDYDQVTPIKLSLLRKASERFKQWATLEQKDQFQQFCESKAYWLDDFALFMAIKREQNGAGWHTWSPEIAKREPEALEQCKQRLSDEILFDKFLQFEFFRQWSDIKHYCD